MSQLEPKTELDSYRIREEKIKFLESHHTIVVATSQNNRVTARTVTFATDGLDFYFMSWDHYEKILQIRENANVALARDNVSVEGTAEILGKPSDEKSKKGAEVAKTKHPKEFEVFSRIPGMVMVQVKPTYIKSWVQIDNAFFVEHLDLENKKAFLKRPEE